MAQLVEGNEVAACDGTASALDGAKVSRGSSFGGALGKVEEGAQCIAHQFRARAVRGLAELLGFGSKRAFEREGDEGSGSLVAGHGV